MLHQHTCPMLLPPGACLEVYLRMEGGPMCSIYTRCQPLANGWGYRDQRQPVALRGSKVSHTWAADVPPVSSPQPRPCIHPPARLPHLVSRCLRRNTRYTAHQNLLLLTKSHLREGHSPGDSSLGGPHCCLTPHITYP